MLFSPTEAVCAEVAGFGRRGVGIRLRIIHDGQKIRI